MSTGLTEYEVLAAGVPLPDPVVLAPYVSPVAAAPDHEYPVVPLVPDAEASLMVRPQVVPLQYSSVVEDADGVGVTLEYVSTADVCPDPHVPPLHV